MPITGYAMDRALMSRHLPNWRLRRDRLNAAPLSHEDWSYRLCQLLNRKWSDADLSERRIRIRKDDSFRTKSGAERVVPVWGKALEVMQRRADGRDESDGPVITDRDGSRPEANRLTRGFKRMVRGAETQRQGGPALPLLASLVRRMASE